MSRTAHEGKVKIYWLSVAPASATHADVFDEITSAELAAGTKLPEITADGVNTNPTDNKASIDMIEEGKISEYPGTFGIAVDLKFAREDEADKDVAWELFEHGMHGWIVVSRFGDPTVGSRIEVYEVHTFEPQPLASAANTFQQYTVGNAVVDWNKKATLVAS